MEFRVLGPVEVRVDDTRIPVGSGRERFVLAVLLLNAGRLTRTDRLIDALWTDPPGSAKAQVHNMISNLRRRLGDAGKIITTDPQGYELHADGHSLDLAEFRRLVDRASAATDPARVVRDLGDALALWRGPALANVPDAIAEAVRAPLAEERLAAAESWLGACVASGQPDKALRELTGLLDEHPYRERLYELQLTALAAVGRRADALGAYRQVHRRLADDLGVEPGPALRELEQRILRGDLAAAPVRPRQLPPVLTVLTGRDELLGELCARLRAPGPSTVLALVGPGGIGKSALAIAAAHEVAGDFPDGQLYADLLGSQAAPVRAHSVLGRFLRALGVPGPDVPEDPDERAGMYRSVLAGLRVLVLLDDVVDEGQLRPLLPGASGCATMITSRRQLGGLIGARRWTVPELSTSDAVRLLGRIAGRDLEATEPAAALVDLCGRLPLAVCVAGARLAVSPQWTVTDYRERLAVERGRLDELAIGDLDVRASIALSYQALEPLPRKLFRRLSLLAGADWPGWVATELLDEPADGPLDGLVGTHLVTPLGTDAVGQNRFRLRDLIADFAWDRLQHEDGEPARHEALARVANGWLALASAADALLEFDTPAESGLAVPDAPRVSARPADEAPHGWFGIERAGLGRTVAQLARSGMGDLAGRLALRMCGFLAISAYDDERERVLLAALAADGPTELRVRLLHALCLTRFQRSDFAHVPRIAADQLAAARQLGSPYWELYARSNQVLAMRRLGQLAAAAFQAEQALATTDTEVPVIRARLLTNLTLTRLDLGEPAAAAAAAEQALALQRASGSLRMIALLSLLHGQALAECGRLAEAEAPLVEAHRLAVEIGDELGVATVHCGLANLHLRRGDLAAAESCLSAALTYYGERRTSDLADALRGYADLAAATGDRRAAIQRLRRSLSIWGELGVLLEVARIHARLERLHASAGDLAEAGQAGAEWRRILADAGLPDRVLRLPGFY